MENTQIRRFRDEDAEATARIFFDAVRLGTLGHYDEAQRRAWAPQVPETSRWLERLLSQIAFVAEQDGRVVGFMTVNGDGYVDLAFVAPDVIGEGVGRRLYHFIFEEAGEMGLRRLYAEASHLALAFFKRQGWSLVREQTVSRYGVSMTNFLVEKHLAGSWPGGRRQTAENVLSSARKRRS